MNRLTEESQIGPFAILKDKAEARPGAFHDYDCLYAHMAAVTRLKAYEDTGMEPEEIKDFVSRWKYATELAGLCKEAGSDRLREAAEADRAGRLVVLDSPRKPLIWGDDEHNSCVCPECGFDLMGIPYGNQMVLQCPECGEYIDAKKCVTYAEAAEAALKAGDNR